MKTVTFELLKNATLPEAIETTLPNIGRPSSAALQRLMEEVRFIEASGSSAPGAYDRAHNRHNRS